LNFADLLCNLLDWSKYLGSYDVFIQQTVVVKIKALGEKG